MPKYAVGTAPGIYAGDRVALVNNAATDSGVTKTQAVAVADVGGMSTDTHLALHNGTNQSVTVQVGDVDADANFRALTDADTNQAITCASGSSVVFTSVGPFVRGLYGTAPTTGTLAITR